MLSQEDFVKVLSRRFTQHLTNYKKTLMIGFITIIIKEAIKKKYAAVESQFLHLLMGKSLESEA